jgi:hypothetical protein
MALTTDQIFDAIAPQLATNPAKAVYLELAEERTAQSLFGAKRTHAIALRAAHMMTLYISQSGIRGMGEAGPITSKSEGSLSVAFGSVSAGSNDDAGLSQTSYGVELLSLIKASSPFISCTSCIDLGLVGSIE